jgi:hypothetical protein
VGRLSAVASEGGGGGGGGGGGAAADGGEDFCLPDDEPDFLAALDMHTPRAGDGDGGGGGGATSGPLQLAPLGGQGAGRGGGGGMGEEPEAEELLGGWLQSSLAKGGADYGQLLGGDEHRGVRALLQLEAAVRAASVLIIGSQLCSGSRAHSESVGVLPGSKFEVAGSRGGGGGEPSLRRAQWWRGRGRGMYGCG